MSTQTQTINTQTKYSEAFRAQREQCAGSSATWVEQLRESAMDRFEILGFPAITEEDWKYTNVAPLAKMDFLPFVVSGSPVSAGTISAIESFSYHESRQSQLVFVNGVYQSELSNLSAVQDGVVVVNLAEAITDERYSRVIREHLAREADYNTDGLIALNTAFLGSGAFVMIPDGLKVDSPLHLLFLSDSSGSRAVCSPRVLVIARSNSSVTLIESYSSVEDINYWTNSVTEIVLEDGANVEHYKLQHESTESFHTATTSADLGSSSVFDSTTITLGAKLSRHGINVKMDHEGAQCHVDGLYIAGEGQHADTHSLIDHLKPHCTSRQLYKGILDGRSRAVFNGKVFVHPDAQQTDAQQTNRNLLLSNDARVDTKPQLEIFADDVKCAHGATVGQLEEDELFYLISRGLHQELAKNLLTFGFAEEVIDKIKIESIKAELGEAVLNRLHARLEV